MGSLRDPVATLVRVAYRSNRCGFGLVGLEIAALFEADAFEVVRDGEARKATLDLNRTDPAAIDKRFSQRF